jgi:hypothetical protein
LKAAKTRALHRKHAGTGKHGSKAKHTPTAHKRSATAHKQTARVVHMSAKAAKARALSLGDVSCCSADALAWSLRLAGWPVADADVLALYRLTADSPDAGASIVATLDAAYVFGLAGVRPLSFQAVNVGVECALADAAGSGGAIAKLEGCDLTSRDHLPHLGDAQAEACGDFGDLQQSSGGGFHGVQRTNLILGVELPGAHTVLAAEGYWWSWGDLYDPAGFPDAVIEEAWAVTWP